MRNVFVDELKETLKQIGSCVPGTRLEETKYGGTLIKGNRKINVSVNLRDSINSKNVKESTKIRKSQYGYYMSIDKFHTRMYGTLKSQIEKALAVKK